MSTLYRQYRPQNFGEVYGQNHITDTLKRAIETERIAHAYLFHGPRGTGKTTTARILAKRLNCEKPNGAEPCGKCKLCTASQSGRNMDIIEIDAASNRGIDDIRALRDAIGLSPSMGKYKVYIVDEVHMLTNEAFSALLKTLEEPVKHAVFILATTEFHKMPETILSRCQVYRFRRASHDEMNDRLQYLLKQEKRKADDEALSFIINRSDGCYRDAESLLGQALTLTDKAVTLQLLTDFLGLPPRELVDQFLTAMVRGNANDAIAAVDEAFNRGLDPEQFLKETITAARDGAISLAKGEKPNATFIQEAAAANRLPIIIRTLIQGIQDLAYVPQPLIALHLAIITVCNRPASATPAAPAPSAPVAKPAVAPKPVASTPPQVVTPVTIEAPSNSKDTASPKKVQPVLALEEAKKLWPELIQIVKQTNPVASTFLRAMEPAAIEGNLVRIQAFYALHRNFFDKAENRQPIEAAFSKLAGKEMILRCFMAEAGPAATVAIQQRRQQQEEALMSAVKEAFA